MTKSSFAVVGFCRAALVVVVSFRHCTVNAAKATYYGGNVNGNACGFNSLGTSTFPYGYAAAIGGGNFDNGYGCGSCWTVTCLGPYSSNPDCFCDPDHPTVTVWANDQCPECDSDHIDLNTAAMEYIVADGLAGTCGVIDITLEQVNCDFSSEISIRAKDGTSEYWYGLHVDNVAGFGAIDSVTLEENDGTSHTCDKSESASFWKCNLVDVPITAPLSVTIEDQGGRTKTGNDVITNFNGGATFNFGQNFDPASIPGSTPGSPSPPGSSPSPPGTSPTGPPTGGCFSDAATVAVLHKGTVPIKDVQLYDMVETRNGYQQVYAWAHFDEDTVAEFLDITTVASSYSPTQSPLQVTPDHLVFVEGKPDPVRASSLRVGDKLQHATSNGTITDIARVFRQGLYDPLTPDGTIVVDGHVASVYVTLQSNTDTELAQVANMIVPPYLLTQAKIFHMALSPLRLWCSHVSPTISFFWPSSDKTGFCHARVEEGGYHPLVAGGIRLIRWAELQHGIVQWAVFIACLLTMFVFFAAETLVVVMTARPALILGLMFALMVWNPLQAHFLR